MSLPKKIKQIALNTIKPFSNNLNDIKQNNVKTNSNLLARVVSYNQSADTYTVEFPDGVRQDVTPGGLRALSPGDGVIVSNGTIIG